MVVYKSFIILSLLCSFCGVKKKESFTKETSTSKTQVDYSRTREMNRILRPGIREYLSFLEQEIKKEDFISQKTKELSQDLLIMKNQILALGNLKKEEEFRALLENNDWEKILHFLETNQLVTKNALSILKHKQKDKIGFSNFLQHQYYLSFKTLDSAPIKPLNFSDNVIYLLPPSDPLFGTLSSTHSAPRGGISDYGVEGSASLAIAARIMMDIAFMPEFSEKFTELLGDMRGRTVFRSIDSDEERIQYSDPLRALHEGLLSLFQTLNFFSLNKLSGYETHNDLIRALVTRSKQNKNGFAANFAVKAYPGFIGPMSVFGYKIDGILLPRNGSFVFGLGLDDWFKHVKQECSKPEANIDKHFNLLGCPIAAAGEDGESVSSLQWLFEAYYKIYKSVYPIIKSSPPRGLIM